MAVKEKNEGFTLVEVLVVISLFSIIAVITTQSLIRIIGNTARSNSSSRVRENLEYALSVVERSVRGAKEIKVCDPTFVQYLDQDNNMNTLGCYTGGTGNLIYNGKPLLSNEIGVDSCSLSCTFPTGSPNANGIEIKLTGKDLESPYDIQPVSLQSTFLMRSY